MAKVYMIDMHSTPRSNLYKKISNLLDAVRIDKLVNEKFLTAIKLHFGERGNTSFIRPIYIRQIVDKILSLKGKPFLTDTNTLYIGGRSNAIDHHQTASMHGFVPEVINCPVIIADGLRGTNVKKISVNKKHFNEIEIAGDIAHSDFLIGVSHFKGHEVTGIGGAIKNIGMGCASRAGKLSQHSNGKVEISPKRCIGCGACLSWCQFNAISMIDEKAKVDVNKCVGCGYCMISCPKKAIYNGWDSSSKDVQERMVEYSYGILKNNKNSLFINFVIDISPSCDCMPSNDVPIAPNIGILVSKDIVAIDQASADLVIESVKSRSKDIFLETHPNVDWRVQIEYAEKIGLGKSNYELVKI